MTHEHTDTDLDPAVARRTRRILLAVVLPLLLATVVGLALLWPRGETPVGSQENPVEGPGFTTAVITEVTGEVGTEAMAELQDGTERIVPIQVPPEIVSAGIEPGDTIRIFFTTGAMGSGSPYVYVDAVRDVPLLLLTGLYVLVVVLVARIRGLMAIVGLLASLGVVAAFLVPALMSGAPAMLTTLVGASAMMFFAVYLAHGVSIRTTTALLGTFIGLAVTTGLAWWSTNAARLSGSGSDSALMLDAVLPGLGLRDLLMCGIVIAGLGALNDVSITQASAVWELHAANPDAPTRSVFARAMRIGRDHIASTVYTLAFAYVGTAMTTLMLVMLYDRSVTSTLTAGEIAEEVVRTLVSSIGLVLAIPATTFIAAMLVRSSRRRAEPVRAGGRRSAGRPGTPVSVEHRAAEIESDDDGAHRQSPAT
ncbi:YibE/F family protein [Pseudactinotalea sp. Z1739]|uniref:YibE/F family protein n=1 Tax=Pseudactinotalea sp. Z1739 TaxID=3413028 RepID=UPI003C7CD95E